MEEKIKIAVHSGNYHADDCMAYAILAYIFPKHELVRTRDEKELSACDFLVDVGGKYDNEKYFDSDFTNQSINFLINIQDDINKILYKKNIFSNIILSFIFIIIFSGFIIYQIKNIFQIIKTEEKNITIIFLLIIFI